jgi:hypothetical protein
MANGYSANVIFVDTDAAFVYAKNIQSIKYIGNANGTASLKSGGTSSGTVIWEESGSSNVINSDLDIRDPNGVYVTLTNGAKVYLYLKS